MLQDVSMVEGGEDTVSVSWDLNTIKEDEFEKYVVYIVPDLPVKSDCMNRAEGSLPRNLVLKPSQALSDVSTFNIVDSKQYIFRAQRRYKSGDGLVFISKRMILRVSHINYCVKITGFVKS